jgi:hypothetical protein
MDKIFTRALIVAFITVAIDFIFHLLLTHPMETVTYFVIKFLLAFLIATALFSWKKFNQNKDHRLYYLPITALIFSTLMASYYRLFELGQAFIPLGSEAPNIYGIDRSNQILFSGTWWLSHALFFLIGAIIAIKLIKDK